MKISNKQLTANRRNAAKSTGPKSVAGKAIVARNAMTHGLRAQHVLIDGESEEEFEQFREAMIAYYKPVGILEDILAAKIVVGVWRFWRARRIENEIMYCLGEEPVGSKAEQLPFRMVITKTYDGGRHETEETMIAGLEGAGILNKFIRYEAHIDRMLSRSVRDLERVQEKRLGK